ncbi:MAG: Hsp20/alpha crystallin family protein [Planctomycetota bacterium]|nr:Hsp20/alpha crystallin family protein [Planctomycetota bacterium]
MFNTRDSVWDLFGEMQSVLDAITITPGTRTDTAAAKPASIPVNVWTKDDAVAVSVELPGYERDSIELTVEDKVLTISATRSDSVPEGATVLRRERGDQRVTRSVRLPAAVDSSQAQARYRQGVLLVVLPLSSTAKKQSIPIVDG